MVRFTGIVIEFSARLKGALPYLVWRVILIRSIPIFSSVSLKYVTDLELFTSTSSKLDKKMW